MKLIKVAAAALNQTPLDWSGNLSNISSAISRARADSASLLCLPELAISGYGCEDAFFYSSLKQTIETLVGKIAQQTTDIGVAVGLPLWFENALYDGVCLIHDQKILGFSAKHFLAGDGIHYEPRWFKAWSIGRQEKIHFAGAHYPLGDYLFDLSGVRIGFEICEDAWSPRRVGAEMSKSSVDLILNPSASHFAFGKHETRSRIVQESSRAFGAAYLYANLLGNEAGRAIYDGCCFIASAGRLVASSRRFSYADISYTSAIIDIEENRQIKRQLQSFGPEETDGDLGAENSRTKTVNRYGLISFPSELLESQPQTKTVDNPTGQIPAWERSPQLKEQEFSRAVALGLFDYLRKSRSNGFVVSLSGGADSAATACMVALMVKFAVAELGFEGFRNRLSHIKSLNSSGEEKAQLQNALTQLLFCIYQATKNSSETTANAAAAVAKELGATFYSGDIQQIVEKYRSIAEHSLGVKLTWEQHDISLQNIQARSRGPLVWLIANLRGALLLATSNRSEAAVGYTTMDGDTCGGLSPIAGIDKAFLLHWLAWLERGGVEEFGPFPALSSVTCQQPTAELRPSSAAQTDEADLMPYTILDSIERLAIRDKRLPLEVFKLLHSENPQLGLGQLGQWVERFFTLWSRNQWKRERYAPCFHLDDENLDPKTWCRFPILSGGFVSELVEMNSYIETISGKS